MKLKRLILFYNNINNIKIKKYKYGIVNNVLAIKCTKMIRLIVILLSFILLLYCYIVDIIMKKKIYI